MWVMRVGGGYSVSNCYQRRDQKMCSGIVINLGSSQGVWIVLLLSFSEREIKEDDVFKSFEFVCELILFYAVCFFYLSSGPTCRMTKTRATMDSCLEVLERNVETLRKVMEDRDE